MNEFPPEAMETALWWRAASHQLMMAALLAVCALAAFYVAWRSRGTAGVESAARKRIEMSQANERRASVELDQRIENARLYAQLLQARLSRLGRKGEGQPSCGRDPAKS